MMREFNELAPAIDRVFRFVEMIGITALLGTVLQEYGSEAAQTLIFFGTLLAIYYLIEPTVDAVARWAMGEEATITGVVIAVIIFMASMGCTFVATPAVSRLANLIARTIDVTK